MITIDLLGGLGNQMFQIFALTSYALDNDRKLKLPIYKHSNVSKTGAKRPTYWNNIFSELHPFLYDNFNLPYHRRAINKIYSICFESIQQQKIYQEPHYHYAPIPKNKNIRYLKGYFQSHKYFEHNKNTILQMMGMQEKCESIKESMQDMFNTKTISLHFRIGDYVHRSEKHPVQNITYYKNAIQYILSHTSKNEDIRAVYFFEKEDTDMVSEYINTLKTIFPHIEYIPIRHTLEDWEQMLLMSCCTYNIIANSSFSWWGAYLNIKPNIICYPSVWFGKEETAPRRVEDLFPEHWVKISSN